MQRKKGRVFVGLDGSLSSMEAVRRGLQEARMRGAELHAVYVRSNSTHRGYGFGMVVEPPRSPELLDRDADYSIKKWLQEGLGNIPTDIPVNRLVAVGDPGQSLVMLAFRRDDLIVLGASRRGRVRRLFANRTSKYCIDCASCPVIVVPPPSMAEHMKRRRGLRTSALGGDLWRQFESETMRPPRLT